MTPSLTFAERHRQARLYAAQVRVRREMGDKYSHATPWRGPEQLKAVTRRVNFENDHQIHNSTTAYQKAPLAVGAYA